MFSLNQMNLGLWLLRLCQSGEKVPAAFTATRHNHSQGILVANGSSRRRIKPAENKSQRLLGSDDLPDALKILPFGSEDILGKRKQTQ